MIRSTETSLAPEKRFPWRSLKQPDWNNEKTWRLGPLWSLEISQNCWDNVPEVLFLFGFFWPGFSVFNISYMYRIATNIISGEFRAWSTIMSSIEEGELPTGHGLDRKGSWRFFNCGFCGKPPESARFICLKKNEKDQMKWIEKMVDWGSQIWTHTHTCSHILIIETCGFVAK